MPESSTFHPFTKPLIAELTGLADGGNAPPWQQFWLEHLHELSHREIHDTQLSLPPELTDLDRPTAYTGYQPTPVSWFKIPKFDHVLWQADLHIAQTFYSSGTTRTNKPTHQRHASASHFSSRGLMQYKVMSMLHFVTILARTPWHPAEFSGLSLIPPPRGDWANSSLAQMIAWFGELFPLTYIRNPAQLGKLLTAMDRPCWIFGTAAHWMQLTTPIPWHGQRRQLAKIYAFETGGLKRQSSTLLGSQNARQLLYHHIRLILGIDSGHIGSEYSASELASQAWSFDVSSTSAAPSWQQPYYFPAFVEVAVATHRPVASGDWLTASADQHPSPSSREGELCIFDPLRYDFLHPMNTEDRVRLTSQGGFMPLGRSAHYELTKGCSLRVSELTGSAPVADATATIAAQLPPRSSSPPPPLDHGRVLSCLQRLFMDPAWLDMLTAEFHDPLIAQQAAQQLRAALPQSKQAFAGALATSLKHPWLKLTPSQRVLILAPRNHSLATLYHLCFLVTHGVAVTLRVPAAFAQDSCLRLLANKLTDLGAQLSLITDTFRITSAADLEGFDGLIAFGTQTTLTTLQPWCSGAPLLGFGTRYGGTVIHEPKTKAPATAQELYPAAMTDLWALAGRGCMSSQFICLPQHHYHQWLAFLSTVEPPLALPQLTLALCRRRRELQAQGHPHRWITSKLHPVDPRGALMPIYHLDHHDYNWPGTNLTETLPYVWPVIFYACLSTLTRHLDQAPNLGYLASNLEHADLGATISHRPIGQLNLAPWNGYFENRPMFSLPSSSTHLTSDF